MKTYFIGGSPCCGKSSVSETLAKRHGLEYYAFDERMYELITKGARDGNEWLAKFEAMSLDEMWLAPPEKICENAIRLCDELFPYVMADLRSDVDIIAEGAVFLPRFMKKAQIDREHYVCMVPTRDFYMNGISKRLWIPEYLSETSDKEQAFRNFTERDVLYAEYAVRTAEESGYAALVVDGSKTIDENVKFVEGVLGLE